MSTLNDRMNYINLIAPRHIRHSCNDDNVLYFAYFDGDDSACLRCTLITAATVGMSDTLIDNIRDDRERGDYE